jgi:hypothetical protein
MGLASGHAAPPSVNKLSTNSRDTRRILLILPDNPGLLIRAGLELFDTPLVRLQNGRRFSTRLDAAGEQSRPWDTGELA